MDTNDIRTKIADALNLEDEHSAIKYLKDLEENAGDDVVGLLNRRVTKYNETLLSIACRKKLAESTETLIHMGSDVNQTDEVGLTPLLKAVCSTGEHQSSKAIEILLENGAIPDHTDHYGRSTIRMAISSENINVIKALIKHGIKLNRKDGRGESSIHAAIEKGNIKICQLFLEAGADPNIQNVEGQTALHKTCNAYQVSKELVLLLINHNADTKLKDRGGRTAFELLPLNAKKEIKEVVKSLIYKKIEFKDIEI
jgi:ankyrin repeat protein